MNQPVYWSVLVGVAVVTAVARLVVGRPLLARRAVALTRTEFVVAVVSLVALVFHCAAMFFAPWTDALRGGKFLGDPIRTLGTVSHWTYWLPAGALLLAVRRLWWPAPVVLAVTGAGIEHRGGVSVFVRVDADDDLDQLCEHGHAFFSLTGGTQQVPVRFGDGRTVMRHVSCY